MTGESACNACPMRQYRKSGFVLEPIVIDAANGVSGYFVLWAKRDHIKVDIDQGLPSNRDASATFKALSD